MPTKPKSKRVTLSASREIPFDKLVLSEANVRRVKAQESIEELAEDIARRTLLTALTVRPIVGDDGAETGRFEVIAGGRRTRALALLVKRRRLPKTTPIPCIVRTEGLSEEDSLAENVRRAPLHPLDQFRAFQTLREKGVSEDEIAARFFVAPSVVKQRLKLAVVAPDLLDAYAEDAMTLEMLMAFTVSPDHARQLQVWETLQRGYAREPYHIRRMLTEGAVRASDRRARFVGLDAYEAAGGTILRDLFEADDGGWLQDSGLLERLVAEKLAAEADAVRGEGWRWVEAAPDFPYGQTYGMRRIVGEATPLSGEEQTTLEALQEEQAELEDKHASAEELPDDVDARLAEIEAALEALRNRPLRYDPEELAMAGAFVSIDHAGGLRVERGYVRPEDEPAEDSEPEVAREPQAATGEVIAPAADIVDPEDAGTAVDPEEDDQSPLPDRLLVDLTTHRTLALRDALADDPDTAHLAALHAMVLQQFYRYGRCTCVTIRADGVPIGHQTFGLTETAYARSVEARADVWRRTLPADAVDLWDALAELDRDSWDALLAHCVAMTVSAVHDPYARRSETIAHADILAARVGLNMVHAGWEATAQNYLSHVTKARILDAVREARGEAAAEPLMGLKKAEIVAAAEELLKGSGWLPEPLSTPNADKTTATPTGEPTDEGESAITGDPDTEPPAIAVAAE